MSLIHWMEVEIAKIQSDDGLISENGIKTTGDAICDPLANYGRCLTDDCMGKQSVGVFRSTVQVTDNERFLAQKTCYLKK